MGVTGPMSTNPPTEQDLQLSTDLDEALGQMGIFENPEELQLRREALSRLQIIANRWVKTKEIPPQLLRLHDGVSSRVTTSGAIFPFGSYRLGVHFRGADIDSVFVAPCFISRAQFFTEFQAILAKEELVADVHAVPNAFVPVLKFTLMGVEVRSTLSPIHPFLDRFTLCPSR